MKNRIAIGISMFLVLLVIMFGVFVFLVGALKMNEILGPDSLFSGEFIGIAYLVSFLFLWLTGLRLSRDLNYLNERNRVLIEEINELKGRAEGDETHLMLSNIKQSVPGNVKTRNVFSDLSAPIKDILET